MYVMGRSSCFHESDKFISYEKQITLFGMIVQNIFNSFINSNIEKNITQFVGNKAKERISKRVFQENKVCQIFRKTNISWNTRFEIRLFALLPAMSSGLRSNVSTIFPDLSLRFTIFTLRTLKFKKNSFWVLLANDDGLIRQLSNNRPIACGKFTLKSSDLVYMVLSSITFVCL